MSDSFGPDFGQISRETGYKWARRYGQDHSLDEMSRRPHTSPRSTPTKLVKRILSQKKQYPLWGPVLCQLHSAMNCSRCDIGHVLLQAIA